MNQQLLRPSVSTVDFIDDSVEELVRAMNSLYHDGMSYRDISELLRIHEKQVSYLLSGAFSAIATPKGSGSLRAAP